MTHPMMLQELGRQRAADARRSALPRTKREALMNALRNTRLFEHASERDLRTFAKSAEKCVLLAGTTLFHEGDRGDRFYVVVDGCVRVTRNGRKVADLGSGKGFGELALLLDGPRNATVTATDDTELLAFHRRDFGKCLDSSPAFARRMLEATATRLREADAKTIQ
jgi:CRP-like cAMP-binding protein